MKYSIAFRSHTSKLLSATLFRSYRLAIVTLFQLAAATAVPAAEQPVVREVLVSREGAGARIEIRADRSLTYRSYPMAGLDKWVIDLPGAKTTYAGDESKKMRTAPLERITVRQKEVNGDRLTRIGLDYKGAVDFSIKENPLDKGHLIIIMQPAKSSQLQTAFENTPTATAQTPPLQ